METDPPIKPKHAGGRPIGSMSKIAAEARSKAILTGELPHEILLSMARGEVQRIPHEVDQDTGEITKWKYTIPDPDSRIDAAKAAAPYFAPKISTVEVIAGVNDDDLDRIIAGLAAEAGVSVGLDREIAPAEGEAGEGASAPATASSERRRRCAKRID